MRRRLPARYRWKRMSGINATIASGSSNTIASATSGMFHGSMPGALAQAMFGLSIDQQKVGLSLDAPSLTRAAQHEGDFDRAILADEDLSIRRGGAFDHTARR